MEITRIVVTRGIGFVGSKVVDAWTAATSLSWGIKKTVAYYLSILELEPIYAH